MTNDYNGLYSIMSGGFGKLAARVVSAPIAIEAQPPKRLVVVETTEDIGGNRNQSVYRKRGEIFYVL